MAIFKGAAVAIVTPMHEDGKVNYEKLEELLEYQIANSTDAIVICGTTGESSTLTHGEHLQTIKFAIDKVAGRVPVIAGTGSNCTETAVMMSQEAASYGADALLIVTPYYNKASQKGLIRHYTEIANSVPETPIIMYNVPSRTGCNIQPATAVALAKNVKNIVGIKAASGDLSQIAKMMSMADGALELYSGNDDQVLPILSLGGLGVISVLSNVAPKNTHDMVMKFMEQVQNNGDTIEGELNRALSSLLKEEIAVIGASRTDSGVHALGNVAVFDTEARMPAEKMAYALNSRLPEDIRVQQSFRVDDQFHPRKTSCIKTYEYRVLNREFELPGERLNSHFFRKKLDVAKMREACLPFLGEHDFKSFCSIHTQAETTVRIIYSLDVIREGDMIRIRVTGNGFLYNMVRILFGSFLLRCRKYSASANRKC